jgi:hypothetical protein
MIEDSEACREQILMRKVKPTTGVHKCCIMEYVHK